MLHFVQKQLALPLSGCSKIEAQYGLTLCMSCFSPVKLDSSVDEDAGFFFFINPIRYPRNNGYPLII